MYKATIEYKGIDKFLLILQKVHGYSSDAFPITREKVKWLLKCVESALDKTFEGSLSRGDFCTFVELGLNSHFLLSINLSNLMFKGYDLSIHQLKLLKASAKSALNKEVTEVEDVSG